MLDPGRLHSPFPAREAAGRNAIKPECEKSAKDSTEVSNKGDSDNPRGQFIRAVPVTELKKQSRPKACLKQPKKCPNNIETSGISQGGMATKDDSPRNLPQLAFTHNGSEVRAGGLPGSWHSIPTASYV
jgi:hypothetical protein